MSKPAFAIVLTMLCACACASSPAGSEPAPAQPAAAPAQPATPGAASAPAATSSAPQFLLVNASGELVPVEGVLVPGKVTVVDFSADWCAPCKVLEKKLAADIHDEPRIAVRKIDVGKADAEEVAARYGVKNLPHVRIYGPDGTLLHDLVGPEAEQTGQLAREALRSL